MDTFYISHGSPTLSIDESLPARHFLKSWKEKVMGQRPTSILVISAHWETHEPTVNVVPQNDTIYDFYGFPKSMYKLKYPAPGAPELAKRVKELLMASNFKSVKEDKKRGLDHGAWVPLMLMYPEADIPVCQLSVQTNRDGSYHYNMGRALAPLREEGVLIIGSGSATHNLRALNPNSESVVPWAYEFDTWLKEALLDGRYEDINHYEEKAPHAKEAHPWPEHFYPLHVAMGAAGENAKAKLIHHSWSLVGSMAESFAFGIADRVVGKLASLAVQEVNLAWGVKSQVEELKDTMSTIRAVLLDAEKKQAKDHRLSIWLGKLKDVFYEAEDVVDEVEFEVLRQAGGIWDEVRNFFSSSNPLASRCRIGHKMKNIRERLDKIAAEKSQFNLVERFGDMSILHREREMTHSFVRASDVIGRQGDRENVVRLLIQSNDSTENVSVIPIVGIGGLGKTTLAKLVYNDDRVVSRFHKKMWVCVSEDFDVQRLTKEILTSLTDERCDHLSIDKLQNRLRNELDDISFLLILDDVWNTNRDKWLELKAFLMGGAKGSKIVVTTRSKLVASIMGISPAYELGGLSHEECLSLLVKCAFRDGQGKQYPNLVQIGKDIIKKCGGVPLAVRTLGGLLYLKTDEHDWVSVRDNEIWKLEQKEDDILPALKLSYDELPFDLKQCFAFCSLFPKDYKFSNLELIQMWMAQGLIPSSQQNQEVEDIGNRYINELLLRCFFEDVVEEIQRVWYYFKMHDLVHDLALSVAQPECTMLNFYTQNVSKKVQHVSILDTHWPKEEGDVLRFLGKLSNVRTISFPIIKAGPTSESFVATSIGRFKHMRVLDLTNSSFGVLPNSICNLKHLRCLNLSNNNKIKKLPNSICKLRHLQILLLDGCISLEELPRDVGKMMSLRHLEVTTKETSVLGHWGREYFNSLRLLCIRQCNYMESLMRGLRRLTALRTLVIADCFGRASLSVELTALETLLICNCANLDLSYGFSGLGRLQVFGIWELPYLVTLPQWLLHGPTSNTLRHLLIHDCDNFRALPEEDGLLNLTSLETLVIEECPQFSALPEGMRHLTALRRLDIRYCPKLSALPEGMRHLPSLTHLKIERCNKMLTQRCKPGIGEDWDKIAHVLDIYLDGKRISRTNNRVRKKQGGGGLKLHPNPRNDTPQ